jgi:hypothetical protein
MTRIVAIVAMAVFCGCVIVPFPMPAGLDRSVLAIAMKHQCDPIFFGLFCYETRSVYFVRLDHDNQDPFSQEDVIFANYLKDEYVYLVNAKPGRYAAVKAVFGKTVASANPQESPTEFVVSTYLSKDLIQKTLVEVRPSSVVFMGEFVVEPLGGMKGADEAQLHYYRLLEPGAENRGFFRTLLFGGGSSANRGTEFESDQSEEAKRRFLEAARPQLEKSGWLRILRNPVDAVPD